MGWFSRVQASPSIKKMLKLGGKVFGLFLLLITSNNAYAQLDIQAVLTNLSNIIVPLTAMCLALSYVIGVYMIIHAITLMKRFGNLTSGQAQPGEMGGPLMNLFVGAVLIYLPTSTDVLMNTLFGTTNSLFGGGINYANAGVGASLLGYTQGDTLGAQWQAMANTLVLYIQFMGLLSFIKGWMLMSKSVGAGSQPGNFAKGVTHIIGGIVAMNFVGVVNIIKNTVYGA